MIFLFIYIIGLVVIYFGSVFVEKRWPNTLKSRYHGYEPLTMVSLIWPMALVYIVLAGIFMPLFYFITWPWRRAPSMAKMSLSFLT